MIISTLKWYLKKKKGADLYDQISLDLSPHCFNRWGLVVNTH